MKRGADQFRLCNYETPRLDGDLCPDFECNRKYTDCNETNFEGNV